MSEEATRAEALACAPGCDEVAGAGADANANAGAGVGAGAGAAVAADMRVADAHNGFYLNSLQRAAVELGKDLIDEECAQRVGQCFGSAPSRHSVSPHPGDTDQTLDPLLKVS